MATWENLVILNMQAASKLLISVFYFTDKTWRMSSRSSGTSRISTTEMERILDKLKSQHNRASTQKIYHSVWRTFNNFLMRLDRRPEIWEDRTALFCTHLVHDRGVQSSTLKSYISAIKCILKDDGYGWNDNKVLLSALIKSCKLVND